jgi:hypothetical protein
VVPGVPAAAAARTARCDAAASAAARAAADRNPCAPDERALHPHSHSRKQVTLYTRGKKAITEKIADDTDSSYQRFSRAVRHIAGDRKVWRLRARVLAVQVAACRVDQLGCVEACACV